jgi:hypothetical protein
MSNHINSKYAFVLIMTSQLSVAGDLPNPKLTTGTINPEITQHNIQNTICVKGYTKTVRPPAYLTNKLKKKQIIEYGYEDNNPKHYEEDHLIPLSIGGSPNDPQNLWPQPRMGEWNAQKKDILELRIHKHVCEGSLSLDEARVAFVDNWIAAYKRFVLGPPNLNK